MCYSCYEEYGKPEIITDKTKLAASLIGLVVGSANLHIVIDDWNLDDDSVIWCIENSDLDEEEQMCLDNLFALTEDERASAMAIAHGWLK